MLDTKLTKSMTFHPQTDGQIEVVNKMIVHILQMYNSKDPRKWDEILPYVHHNYKKSLQISTGHSPFQDCCTSSRWVTKFGYICRRSASLDPTARFSHPDMGHTTSPRL